jgi:hypothetical protein
MIGCKSDAKTFSRLKRLLHPIDKNAPLTSSLSASAEDSFKKFIKTCYKHKGTHFPPLRQRPWTDCNFLIPFVVAAWQKKSFWLAGGNIIYFLQEKKGLPFLQYCCFGIKLVGITLQGLKTKKVF